MQPAQPPRVPTRAARYPDAGADVEGWQTPPAYAAAARASPRVSTSEAIPTTTDRRCCRRGKRTPTPNCQQWVLTWSAAVLVASVAVYGFLWLRGGSLTYASLVGNLHAGTAAPIDSQVLHVAMDDDFDHVRSTPKTLRHFPNIDYLGRGYDLRRGNPRPTTPGGDPGFRQAVFQLEYDWQHPIVTADKAYELPLGVKAAEAIACAQVFTATAASSAREFLDTLHKDTRATVSSGSSLTNQESAFSSRTPGTSASFVDSAHPGNGPSTTGVQRPRLNTAEAGNHVAAAVLGLARGGIYDATEMPTYDGDTHTGSAQSGDSITRAQQLAEIDAQQRHSASGLNRDTATVARVLGSGQVQLLQTEATCSVYDAQIQHFAALRLSPSFLGLLDALEYLSTQGADGMGTRPVRYLWQFHPRSVVHDRLLRPPAANKAFDDFVRNFGTHVLSGATFGAVFGSYDFINSTTLAQLQQGRNASIQEMAAGAAALEFLQEANGGGPEGLRSGPNSNAFDYRESVARRQVLIAGSRPTASLSASSWVKSVSYSPMPVRLDLVHLLDVITPLVSEPTWRNVAEAMRAAYYCPIGGDGYQCSSHGYCESVSWTCACEAGWSGPSCEIKCTGEDLDCFSMAPSDAKHHSSLFRSFQ